MRLGDIKDEENYEIKSLGRRIPGKYLKNPAIQKGIHEEIQRRKEEVENERRFYLNIGDTPVLQIRTSPPAYIIRSNFPRLRDLLPELSMPEHPPYVYCSALAQASDIRLGGNQAHKNAHKYSAEIFGLLLNWPGHPYYSLRDLVLNELAQYKSQPIYWTYRPGYIAQVWRLRLFPCTTSGIRTNLSNPLSSADPEMAYLEERWHPRQGFSLSLNGLNHLSESQIPPFIEFTKDALRIMRRAKRSGRPRWSGEYQSPEEFIEKYKAAYLDVKDKAGHKPKQQAVADKLGICPATLRNYIRGCETKWPPP